MSTHDDLLALVNATTPSVNDPARRGLADWLDEHPECQRTPVSKFPVPKGFNEWWHRYVLPRHPGERLRPWSQSGRWGNYDIIRFLNNMGDFLSPAAGDLRHWNWFDHGGFSVIADQSVVVGEPYGTEEESRVTAALLQGWLGCPVTYDRCGRHSPESRRLVVWYGLATDLPPVANPAVAETERFIRQRLTRAEGESLSFADAYCSYLVGMSKTTFLPLSRAEFVEHLRRVFRREARGSRLLGVGWTPVSDSCPTD